MKVLMASMLERGSVFSTSVTLFLMETDSKGFDVSKIALLAKFLKVLSYRELLEENTRLARDLVSKMFFSFD